MTRPARLHQCHFGFPATTILKPTTLAVLAQNSRKLQILGQIKNYLWGVMALFYSFAPFARVRQMFTFAYLVSVLAVLEWTRPLLAQASNRLLV